MNDSWETLGYRYYFQHMPICLADIEKLTSAVSSAPSKSSLAIASLSVVAEFSAPWSSSSSSESNNFTFFSRGFFCITTNLIMNKNKVKLRIKAKANQKYL